MQRKNAPLSAAPTAPPKPQLSEFAWGSKGCTAPLPREAEEDGRVYCTLADGSRDTGDHSIRHSRCTLHRERLESSICCSNIKAVVELGGAFT